MEVPQPPDEESRLAVLNDLDVLDTESEPEFDAIVGGVARLLGMPIAVISLVDRDRLWLKASTGLDVCEVDRRGAFCEHAILRGDEALVVEDATADPRFAGSGLVTAPPNIRFYVGAPLMTSDGAAIGTLCAMDTRPRTISAADCALLHVQAAAVVARLEERRASRRLAKRNAELERSNQLLRQFQRALAHDVMTPIEQVGFFVEQLDEHVSPSGRRSFENVRTGVERLERLVLALRGFVATGGQMALSPTGLDDVVSRVLENARVELESVAARVTVHGLPTVLGHSEHLQRVVANLVSNAIKYRADRPLTLTIDAERRSTGWRINVRDNGIGIAQKFHERVFEPMRRLHTEGEIPGVGLGLSLVRQVIEGCGGSVGLTSEPDVGTTVWFELSPAD